MWISNINQKFKPGSAYVRSILPTTVVNIIIIVHNKMYNNMANYYEQLLNDKIE